VVSLHRALVPGKGRPLGARGGLPHLDGLTGLTGLTGLMRSPAEAPSLAEPQHPLERVRGNHCLYRIRPG
jgi:hypothetical protein